MNVGRLSVVSIGLFIILTVAGSPVIGGHSSAAVLVAWALAWVLSFVYAMYLWLAVIRYGDRRLQQRGVKGSAQVLSSKETNWRMSAGEYMGIGAPAVWKYGLEVTMPGKQPYRTTLYICAHLPSGKPIPVCVSRLNPKRVTVDAAALTAVEQEIADDRVSERAERMRAAGQNDLAERYMEIHDPKLGLFGTENLSSDPVQRREQMAERREKIKEIMGGQTVVIGGAPGQSGGAPARPARAAGAGGAAATADALTKLADLRDRGALSEEEFQHEKQRLLGE
jgi:Short C-terminal domain